MLPMTMNDLESKKDRENRRNKGLDDEGTLSRAPHLDDPSGSPHAEEVLPLQHGPEAALQSHDPPQHLLVEEGLQTVALCLPQEHLRHKQAEKKKKTFDGAVSSDERKRKAATRRAVPWCGPLDSQREGGGSV